MSELILVPPKLLYDRFRDMSRNDGRGIGNATERYQIELYPLTNGRLEVDVEKKVSGRGFAANLSKNTFSTYEIGSFVGWTEHRNGDLVLHGHTPFPGRKNIAYLAVTLDNPYIGISRIIRTHPDTFRSAKKADYGTSLVANNY